MDCGDRTILILEDDPGILNLFGAILRRQGLGVLQACDGVEAMRIAEAYPRSIDLVVCDVLLQRESGAHVLASLRELFPDLRAVLLSGFPLESLLDRGLVRPGLLDSGMVSFLQKPFLPVELIGQVDALLNVRSRVSPARAAAAGGAFLGEVIFPCL